MQTLAFVMVAVMYLNQTCIPQASSLQTKSLLVVFLIGSLIGSLAAAKPLWNHYVPTEMQHVDISVTTER